MNHDLRQSWHNTGFFPLAALTSNPYITGVHFDGCLHGKSTAVAIMMQDCVAVLDVCHAAGIRAYRAPAFMDCDTRLCFDEVGFVLGNCKFFALVNAEEHIPGLPPCPAETAGYDIRWDSTPA